MADPNEKVQMVHPDVTDDGGPVVVEVTRHEFESVWKNVGWKLQSKSKEK